MPSLVHQGLAILLLESPRLLAWLLRHVLGLPLPEDGSLESRPETIRRLDVPDHYADGVVAVTGGLPEDREAFVTEIQLRKDDMKRYTWAVYVSDTARRLRCPTSLVVVTTSEAVERWCADTIDLGRGCVRLQPLVLGPSNIPHRIDPTLARELPELAVLAVAMHGRGAESLRTIRTALDAIAILRHHDDRRARLYRRLLTIFAEPEELDMLTKQMEREYIQRIEFAAALKWDSIMRKRARRAGHEPEPIEGVDEVLLRQLNAGYEAGREEGREEGRAEGLEEGREEGCLQGRIDALFLVLSARSLHPTEQQRTTIEACEDDAVMNQWLQRAVWARDVAEVLTPAR